MNKGFLLFFSNILLTYVYASTDKISCLPVETTRRRMGNLTQEDCDLYNTPYYKCILDIESGDCIQFEKSACEQASQGQYQERGPSSTTDNNEGGCYELETSDDELYDCIPSPEGGCMEVPIDNCNNLKLSIAIFCLLLFI